MAKGANRNNPDFFDAVAFGEILKRRRRQIPTLEYDLRSSEGFRAAVLEITGYEFTESSYYRIQRGEREPTLSEFIALALTLYGSLASEELYADLMECSCNRIQFLEEEARGDFWGRAIRSLVELERVHSWKGYQSQEKDLESYLRDLGVDMDSEGAGE